MRSIYFSFSPGCFSQGIQFCLCLGMSVGVGICKVICSVVKPWKEPFPSAWGHGDTSEAGLGLNDALCHEIKGKLTPKGFGEHGGHRGMRRVWGWAPFPGVSGAAGASHPCWNSAQGSAAGFPCLERRELVVWGSSSCPGNLAEKRGKRNSPCACSRQGWCAPGSGRALQSTQRCSALGRTLCPPWGLGQVPVPVFRTIQALCHRSRAEAPRPDALSAVQLLNSRCWCLSMSPRSSTCIAFVFSALALLFRPFSDSSPIHIFAFQANCARWALGGASSTAPLCATSIHSALVPLHLRQPCQASPV